MINSLLQHEVSVIFHSPMKINVTHSTLVSEQPQYCIHLKQPLKGKKPRTQIARSATTTKVTKVS